MTTRDILRTYFIDDLQIRFTCDYITYTKLLEADAVVITAFNPLPLRNHQNVLFHGDYDSKEAVVNITALEVVRPSRRQLRVLRKLYKDIIIFRKD